VPVEYDEELPEGEHAETIMISNDGQELGTVLKVGTGNTHANPICPEGIEDDDDIIDYFLENN